MQVIFQDTMSVAASSIAVSSTDTFILPLHKAGIAASTVLTYIRWIGLTGGGAASQLILNRIAVRWNPSGNDVSADSDSYNNIRFHLGLPTAASTGPGNLSAVGIAPADGSMYVLTHCAWSGNDATAMWTPGRYISFRMNVASAVYTGGTVFLDFMVYA